MKRLKKTENALNKCVSEFIWASFSEIFICSQKIKIGVRDFMYFGHQGLHWEVYLKMLMYREVSKF